MPRRPAGACTWPGCPNPGPGRCPTHRDQRPHSSARGYDHRWARTRSAYLAAHPRCEHPACQQPAAHVDHLDGHGPNGPRGHDWRNLRALCQPHHSQRTARDQPGGWNAR